MVAGVPKLISALKWGLCYYCSLINVVLLQVSVSIIVLPNTFLHEIFYKEWFAYSISFRLLWVILNISDNCHLPFMDLDTAAFRYQQSTKQQAWKFMSL